MDELSSRARALLSAAHGADDPAPGDSSRVRRSVLLRIGSAGFGATVFSLSLQRAQAFFGLAAPKLVAVVALAVGGSAVYHRLDQGTAPVHVAPSAVHAPRLAEVLPKSALLAEPPLAAPAPIETPPVATPSRERRPRQARVAPTLAHVDLEAEMRSVRAADAALRAGNMAAAQALLDEHARDFPSGVLSEEREGLRTVAGCQAQSGDGNRAAARFLERAPRSLLAGRIRAACPRLAAASPAPMPAPSAPGG